MGGRITCGWDCWTRENFWPSRGLIPKSNINITAKMWIWHLTALASKSWLCHFLGVWLWTRDWICPCLGFPFSEVGAHYGVSWLSTQTQELMSSLSSFGGYRHHRHGVEPGREATGSRHPGRHLGCVGHGREAGDSHPNWTHRWGLGSGLYDHLLSSVPCQSVISYSLFTTRSLLCIKTLALFLHQLVITM